MNKKKMYEVPSINIVDMELEDAILQTSAVEAVSSGVDSDLWS